MSSLRIMSMTRRLMSSSSHQVSEHQKKLMARGLPKKRELAGVKRIVCVASGKGGVGKSTVAVNVACTLANKFNMSVGLLDADIYGPSVPTMMGLLSSDAEVAVSPNGLLVPQLNYNVRCMSMGFLVAAEDALVWRGLMVMSALDKLLFKCDWGSLDMLVVDMPPGTGDVQLSVSQSLVINGALIVTTPQRVALADARRAIAMFDKVQVRNVGIVQNMSGHQCSQCGHVDHIFAGGDGDESGDELTQLSTSAQVPIIGRIPVVTSVRQSGDTGRPICVAQPQHPVSLIYENICRQLIDTL